MLGAGSGGCGVGTLSPGSTKRAHACVHVGVCRVNGVITAALCPGFH